MSNPEGASARNDNGRRKTYGDWLHLRFVVGGVLMASAGTVEFPVVMDQ